MEFSISDLTHALEEDLSQTYEVHHSGDTWNLERGARTIRLILSGHELFTYANRIRKSASGAIGLDEFQSVVSLIGVHIVETTAMLPDDKNAVILDRDRFVGR